MEVKQNQENSFVNLTPEEQTVFQDLLTLLLQLHYHNNNYNSHEALTQTGCQLSTHLKIPLLRNHGNRWWWWGGGVPTIPKPGSLDGQFDRNQTELRTSPTSETHQ